MDQQARLIIHLDMDCFYVSVERLHDPSLEGKPVAVGGSADGRGVVASASYEARAYGVRSAMPMSQALRLCPNLIAVNSPYSSYATYSRRIHGVLLEFTPLVQLASQDEAYLDVTGTERLHGSPLVVAQKIRDRVLEETRLPCSLGVASSKTVAKIASGLCKPKGMLFVPRGSEAHFLAPLPVKRLPGIGPKAQERLASMGITRLGQIAAMDMKTLNRVFGSHGESIGSRANGQCESPVTTNDPAKSISAEETFAEDSRNMEFLVGILSNLCEKVAYRIRQAECRAATVSLKFRYSDFETHTAARTLSWPTDDEGEMLNAVRELLADRWDRRRAIRLLGVAGSNLRFDEEQLDLLETPTNERKKRLHEAIDRVRDRHGYGVVRRGSSGGRGEAKNEKQWG